MSKHQSRSTRIVGTTVFAVLRVDRRAYEYARMWAERHSGPGLDMTAEDQLEGYLNAAMKEAMEADDWQCPPAIDALYPPPKPVTPAGDLDDDIPF